MRMDLHYFYEEKWHQGHKCIEPRLFLLEGMELSSSNAIEIDWEWEQVTDLVEGVVEKSVEIPLNSSEKGSQWYFLL